MTQEEERLLFIDLCARLPYGVIVYSKGEPHIQKLVGYIPDIIHYNIKPYLRPFSSMTEEEREEESDLWNEHYTNLIRGMLDFYCSHHLDWNNLIPQGLALEAHEGMYK